MEQRHMRLVNLIEVWTFIPLFLFFNMLNHCFQDASAQVTEGLVLKVQNGSRCLCAGNRVFDTDRHEFLAKASASFQIIHFL